MNTETLYISKETNDTYTSDEVLLCFTNSDNLDEIKAYVEKAEERLFVSWASVEGTDNSGEKIPIGIVVKAQEALMKRGAPIMYRHTNKNVGKTLGYKVAQHPKTMKIGLLQLNKIFDDLPIDEEVWADIKSGKLKGLSVGGQGVVGSKEYNEELKSMVDVYSKFGQYETSVAENPTNPLALNEAFSTVAKEEKMTEEKKLQDVLKELSDTVNSIKTDVEALNSKVENITKEDEPAPAEETVEEKEVKPEVDKEESALDSLTAQVGDLSAKVESLTKEAEPAKEVVKEEPKEVVTMEAPAVNVEKEEKVKDITKEYNDVMAKFERGEVSFHDVTKAMRESRQ